MAKKKRRRSPTWQLYYQQRKNAQARFRRAKKSGKIDQSKHFSSIFPSAKTVKQAERQLLKFQRQRIEAYFQQSRESSESQTQENTPQPAPPPSKPPTWDEIVVETFYNEAIASEGGTGQLDAFRAAKWGADDLNDLVRMFVEQLTDDFGMEDVARSIMHAQEDLGYDPFEAGWSTYNVNRRITFLSTMLQYLSSRGTGDISMSYDLLTEIMGVVDEGYLGSEA